MGVAGAKALLQFTPPPPPPHRPRLPSTLGGPCGLSRPHRDTSSLIDCKLEDMHLEIADAAISPID